MVTAIVGHRGTGKTELLKRLGFYLRDQDVELLDLDSLIENKIGKTIREMFLENGENYFRELERQVFLETIQNRTKETYIVLGAGFNLDLIPDTAKVLWVRRQTDLDGRIFLDRPRLDLNFSPLQEFRTRATERETRFQNRYDDVYLMPEGVLDNRYKAQAVEKDILTKQLKEVGGTISMGPEYFLSEDRLNNFVMRFKNAGLDYIEFRDDLLTLEQIQKCLDLLPEQKYIYSFRKEQSDLASYLEEHNDIFKKATWIDWAAELGEPRLILETLGKDKLILSLHEKNFELQWKQWAPEFLNLKWAPLIFSHEELDAGIKWQQEDSLHRSFLPRSRDGKWLWFRLYQKNKQLLNFLKESVGSALDQPSLFQWLMVPKDFSKFAAVLGQPVSHSYSPIEHSDYFSKKEIPIFAIAIGRGEFVEYLKVLRSLGLTYACVTSPLKEEAAKKSEEHQLEAVNTLYWCEKKNQWIGVSTDDRGFAELVEGWEVITPAQSEIAVWGGGGVLEMMRTIYPHALYFEARTGKLRDSDLQAEEVKPQIVVWAAQRTNDTKFPPQDWKPKIIYDLNYKEDSMGKDYAQICGANYQSGLVMFEGQARYQRAFWEEQVQDECE